MVSACYEWEAKYPIHTDYKEFRDLESSVFVREKKIVFSQDDTKVFGWKCLDDVILLIRSTLMVQINFVMKKSKYKKVKGEVMNIQEEILSAFFFFCISNLFKIVWTT